MKFVAVDCQGRITGCLTSISGELLNSITSSRRCHQVGNLHQAHIGGDHAGSEYGLNLFIADFCLPQQ